MSDDPKPQPHTKAQEQARRRELIAKMSDQEISAECTEHYQLWVTAMTVAKRKEDLLQELYAEQIRRSK